MIWEEKLWMMEFIPTSICFSFRTNSRFRIQLHVNFMESKHLSSIQSFKSQQHITYFATNPYCIVLSDDSSCCLRGKLATRLFTSNYPVRSLIFFTQNHVYKREDMWQLLQQARTNAACWISTRIHSQELQIQLLRWSETWITLCLQIISEEVK